LAAIILTDDNNTDWCETVCITSGSDIISSHNLEPEFVLIDCRAATLARRCFIRYLYKKLNELVEREVEEENSLFTSIPASNRFELKKNIKVNLFLNQPPDCNTNSSNNIANGSVNRPKKMVGKLIRLKSTTDKISLWNQVGIQGSILSHFVDPIFINSVIIAFDFNEKSIHRHFVINYTKEPKLMKCELIKKQINEKSNKLIINGYNKLASNWIQTEDYVEIINCDSGKAISDDNHEQYISRLSKHELNKCFRDFLTNYEYNLRPHQALPMTYRKWKESAPNYRIQKQLLKVRYAVAGRQWNTMPSDLDMFI
jgi:double stranded RNA-specific editase B